MREWQSYWQANPGAFEEDDSMFSAYITSALSELDYDNAIELWNEYMCTGSGVMGIDEHVVLDTVEA